MARYDGIGDDRCGRARFELRKPLAQLGESAATDDHVIAAGAERDVDDRRLSGGDQGGRHALSPCAGLRAGASSTASRPATAVKISSTMISCGTSRECTLASACA